MNAEQVMNGARALGLHHVPAALLTSLVSNGPASQAALSVRLGVAPSTVSRAVRVLDDMGLVETLPLRRNVLVRPVPFDTSLPALTERHRQQMAREVDRLVEACASLGVSVEPTWSGPPAGPSLQPVPVGSCEPPYVVPQSGFAGGDLHWQLSTPRCRRDIVLSGAAPGVQAPGARQLLIGGPGKVVVRVVVTSCESIDGVWRRQLREYAAAEVNVRVVRGRSAPFMIVDEERVGLNVIVAGEQRRVWVREPEQLASLIRLFAALWADGGPLDLDTLHP